MKRSAYSKNSARVVCSWLTMEFTGTVARRRERKCVRSALCGFLLLRDYGRQRYRLLVWSGLCFSILALNNFLLVVDKLILPAEDLSLLRTGTALIAMVVL